MARKSIVQLKNKLLVDFPDNNAKLITAAILRQYFTDFLDAIRPAYGLLSRPTGVIQQIGVTDVPIVFDTGAVSDVPDYTASPATGTLNRLEAGTTRATINATIEAANTRLITLTLYKNGVATPWRASVVAQGAGKPVDITIVALNYDAAAAAYQLRGKSDTAATDVTFSNMDMLCETVIVNTY